MRSVEGELPTAQFYADFAEHEAVDSPVFFAWARGVSQDSEVLALLAQLPEAKRQPNLVFAAARWHGAPVDAPGSASYDELRRVLLNEWPAVRATIAERSTQTNEAARCATLLPELARIDGPIALLEVGAAAGLCLMPDLYSYRYWRGEELVARLDPVGTETSTGSSVVLDCLLHDIEPPERLPEVVWRGGLDLNPLDAGSPDDAAWLETLIWPEDTERRHRLASALKIARDQELHLREGDLAWDLALVAAEARQAAPDATVVVQHSAVLAYVPKDVRRGFARAVWEQSDVWLANEGHGILPGMPEPPRRPAFVLSRDGRAIAFTHPHGRWMQGLG